MSLVLTIVVIWIAASLAVGVAWALVGLHLRQRRAAQHRAERDWRELLHWLAHPRLPRQRDPRRKRGA